MAFKIDPFTKTVAPWAPQGAFLPALRQTIGCLQLDSILVQSHLCAWLDNFGLLNPDAKFFRFRDSPYRFAGVVVFTATDDDGMPISAEGVNLEEIAASIDWCEDVHVVAIREELRIAETELGPWPRVVRITEFNRPVEDAPQGPWDVSARQVPIEAPTSVPGQDGPPGLATTLPGDFMETLEKAADILETMERAVLDPLPEERPTTVWTVLSDDATDSFIASEDDGTGEPTGRMKQFGEMSDVAAFFSEQGAERLVDDPGLPDEVVARFRMPA